VVQTEVAAVSEPVVTHRQTSGVRSAAAQVVRNVSAPVRARGRRGFVPRHLRTAQVLNGQMMGG
jgi:hypothetical protein